MIWNNPFQIKRFEHMESPSMFVQLFNCAVLQAVSPKMLNNVTFFSSSPGAGKTTLFNAYSAEVLEYLCEQQKTKDPEGRDLYHSMKDMGVISEGEARLLTSNISCARNYDILDEMLEPGRRKQFLFALLNCRITITFIRSIAVLAGLKTEEEYCSITFANIPEEMSSIRKELANGRSLFRWACDLEITICRYLDGNDDEMVSLGFLHSTLILLKLFEPKNILLDGETRFNRTLIILDDFHRMTNGQQKLVVDSIYTLRPNVATWIGRRLEGLSGGQIITSNGEIDREFNNEIVLDRYWGDNMRRLRSALEDIADKRVRSAELNGLREFSDCLAKELDEKALEKKICKGLTDLQNELEAVERVSDQYKSVYDAILTNSNLSLLEKAYRLQTLKIKINREENRQLELYLGEVESVEMFDDFFEDNHSVAEFYFNRRNGLPCYYGLETVKYLSSNNIEQFLFFSAGLFERSHVAALGRKKGKRYMIDAVEQDTFIRAASNDKWKEMHFRYVDARSIQSFLDNISSLMIRSRDAERNSYAGGAYTGIGIKNAEIKWMQEREAYAELIDILGRCVASNYLEKRTIGHQSEEYIVFYINRWLCVHYGLPLSYGGWKPLSAMQARDMCNSSAG